MTDEEIANKQFGELREFWVRAETANRAFHWRFGIFAATVLVVFVIAAIADAS